MRGEHSRGVLFRKGLSVADCACGEFLFLIVRSLAASAVALSIFIFFPEFLITQVQAFGLSGNTSPWSDVHYRQNFLKSNFPSGEHVLKMGLPGFVGLWGVLSFVESHLPQGLDGRAYAAEVRDLRKKIEFFKRDMLYLIREVWSLRKIDRQVVVHQIKDLSFSLDSIGRTIQKVRGNLLTAAYYLYGSSLNSSIVAPENFEFSITLNYLNATNLWATWRPYNELTREIEIAKGMGIRTAKIHVYLDPWRRKKESLITIFERTLKELEIAGMKVFVAVDGMGDWYETDFTFGERKGRPTGKVNWITWKYEMLKYLRIFVANYKPSYVTVLAQPTRDTQEQVNEKVSPDKWASFVLEAAGIVKEVSPATVPVVELSVATEEDLALYRQLIEKAGNDLAIGFAVYSLKDFISINQYLLLGRPKGPVFIAELWDSGGLYLDPLAEDFLYMGYYYALEKKARLVNFSFAVNCHTYDFEPTPAYHAIKNIIVESFSRGACLKGIRASSSDRKEAIFYMGGVETIVRR